MWTRESSFPTNVKFYNSAPAATIRQIEVQRGRTGIGFTIHIFPSSFQLEAVIHKCNELFKEKNEMLVYPPRIAFFLSYKTSIEKIEKLITYFDKEYNRNECSPQLIKDLNQIFDAYINKTPQVKLTTPELKLTNAHVNPQANTDSISQLLDLGLSFKSLKKLLVAGHNPNQKSKYDHSVLYDLLHRAYEDIIDIDENESSDVVFKSAYLLIMYGADFTSPLSYDALHKVSVIELTYQYLSVKLASTCYGLMINVINYNAIQASKKKINSTPFAIEANYSQEAKELVTAKFNLPNKSIIKARLEEMNNISLTKRKKCYALFKKYFKNPNEDEQIILQEFENVFEPKDNVLINLIYLNNEHVQEQLIGFNVFEIVCNKNEITWHSWYTVVEPICRGDFPAFFAYGFAHATRFLYRNDHISVYFNPLEYNALVAMGVSTNIVAAPKNQSDSVVKQVERTHSQLKIYRSGVQVIKNEMQWCVKIEDSKKTIQVESKSNTTIQQNPMKEFFANYIKAPNSEPIALYYVADQSAKEFHESAFRLGINSTLFIQQVATLMAPYFQKITKKVPTTNWLGNNLPSIYNSSIKLFFLGADEKSDMNLKFNSPPVAAKL